ncbi:MULTISPECIES: anti-sigma factor antagonist [unclassified Knoellia]|uniref:anti-sigma factor antagonist n=1 Tax=Knoellia altitudinis TaxID=3404795 RepID=UPI00360E562E
MKLTVASTEREGVTIVTVSGEVDVYTAPQLRSALEERIAAGQIALIVDLQDVGFLDSTGLGVLVGRLKAVRKLNGWLRVVCTNERIIRIFGITGLDKVIPIHDTVDAALGADPHDFAEPEVSA